MKYELSEHAMTRLRERKVEIAWLEQTIANPERTEADPDDPRLEHRLAAIPERVTVSSAWSAILDSLRSKL